MNAEHRITRIEAELAIRNVIARYGLAVDCGDIKTALKCHTQDAVYVVSNPNAGRGEANAMENSPPRKPRHGRRRSTKTA